MQKGDFLVIGGGVAGLSAAARLSAHGRVILLEAEEAFGYHSSGRSATFSHYGIGNSVVRALTAASRIHFLERKDPPLARTSPALFVATNEMLPALDREERTMRLYTDTIERVGKDEMLKVFPLLRTGRDAIVEGLLYPDGLRLDSDALLQDFARTLRANHGTVRTEARISRIERSGNDWRVSSASESWTAPILVNAAGAWADLIAELAGTERIGLRPLRRTAILVDPPDGMDSRGWPFVKTIVDDFYILPESGRLMASPVDEIETDPCDAQPEDYDIALAAAKVEQYTILPVKRIVHRWAGLRTFAPDRVPVAGFARDCPGFFWFAGQGGFGLQTAPAMAQAAEALIMGLEWPSDLAAFGIEPASLGPERLSEH